MLHKRLKLRTLLLLLLAMEGLQAQESVNTSSGNALGGGGSVSYSIGQVVYTLTKELTVLWLKEYNKVLKFRK
jgi:hypothetical protein